MAHCLIPIFTRYLDTVVLRPCHFPYAYVLYTDDIDIAVACWRFCMAVCFNRGASVCLFNYRGFSRSRGTPSPIACQLDGEAVMDFLLDKNVRTVGIHGRSIGGIAACHLAAKYPDSMRWLCADRTFSTLSTVAEFSIGRWTRTALRIGQIEARNVQNFLRGRCYKVMISDSRDTVIPEVSALKTGVALAMCGENVDTLCLARGKQLNPYKTLPTTMSMPSTNSPSCTCDAGDVHTVTLLTAELQRLPSPIQTNAHSILTGQDDINPLLNGVTTKPHKTSTSHLIHMQPMADHTAVTMTTADASPLSRTNSLASSTTSSPGPKRGACELHSSTHRLLNPLRLDVRHEINRTQASNLLGRAANWRHSMEGAMSTLRHRWCHRRSARGVASAEYAMSRESNKREDSQSNADRDASETIGFTPDSAMRYHVSRQVLLCMTLVARRQLSFLK